MSSFVVIELVIHYCRSIVVAKVQQQSAHVNDKKHLIKVKHFEVLEERRSTAKTNC